MKGIVFDFDGVICASMAQHVTAYQEALAPLHIPVSASAVYLLEGARSESIIQQLADDADHVLDAGVVASLADEKQRIFRSLGNPPLYDGAEAMIRALPDDVPVGLVTGTRRENLEVLIPDLLPRFQAVMAQADYTQDKPHPEPYLRAAHALGLPPADLVCVENAPRGVLSAQSAGYGHVIAVGTTVDEDSLAHADTFCADHAALAATLQGLFPGGRA